MAKQQKRKLELAQQIESTRNQLGRPKDLLLSKERLATIAKNLGSSAQKKSLLLAKKHPKQLALGSALSALALTLLLKKSGQKKNKKGQKKTIVKYLPAKEKNPLSKKLSKKLLKYGWALALPHLRSWALQKTAQQLTSRQKTTESSAT